MPHVANNVPRDHVVTEPCKEECFKDGRRGEKMFSSSMSLAGLLLRMLLRDSNLLMMDSSLLMMEEVM